MNAAFGNLNTVRRQVSLLTVFRERVNLSKGKNLAIDLTAWIIEPKPTIK